MKSVALERAEATLLGCNIRITRQLEQNGQAPHRSSRIKENLRRDRNGKSHKPTTNDRSHQHMTHVLCSHDMLNAFGRTDAAYRCLLLLSNSPGFVLWYANFFSIVVVSGLAMHALWPMVSLSLGWSIPSFYYIKVSPRPFLLLVGVVVWGRALVRAAERGVT